jgi:peptidoglycan/LPS O-acetylase OafA/YrhL
LLNHQQNTKKTESLMLRAITTFFQSIFNADSTKLPGSSEAVLFVSDRMDLVKNHSSGFDYQRLVLSSAIIFLHAFLVSYGPNTISEWPQVGRIAYLSILPVFFALSGFLVAGSWERTKKIKSFLALRILRIVPALSVEVTLSAIIGPAFTNLPLQDYFTSSEFFIYFMNILGDIHFSLPGVFANNPIPSMVNMQLWTIPYELYCYIALSILAITRVLSFRKLVLLIFAIIQVIFGYHGLFEANIAERATVGGNLLVVCFLAGVLLYLYRDVVRFHHGWGILAGLIYIGLFAAGGWRYFIPIPAAYFTVYIGLLDPPRQKFLLSGDYSYGIYLYGFVIQQAVAAMGERFHHWYINIIISYPIIFGVAMFSWWCIEKPSLKLRKYVLSSK